MKEALKNQIKQGIGMWAILWITTLVIYLLGKNPHEASMIIVGDIIIPIVVLLLIAKYKSEYGSFLK